MFVIKNYVTTGGTVACALAIGYLMQNGTPAQPRGERASVDVASVTDQASIIPGLSEVVLTSSAPVHGTSKETGSDNRFIESSRSEPVNPIDCTLSARATAVPGAAARLVVNAPCHSNESVEIHHSGLTVTQRTDAVGRMDMTIPALSEYAIFLISFEDQHGTVATTHIADIANYERIALQWQGETDLQIHALEFGASYGGNGHVSAETPTEGAGQVVRLGNTGTGDMKNIEIYSFPAGLSNQNGSIEITVETEVTSENCGRDLNIQSLELRDDRLRSKDRTLSFPECSRTGEFLVLNNLFQDLTIAAN
ncbi:hypothetical protein [Ruegeria faecimaris]|uniref:Uncharacterized protein n=1 Tax=Ruegeria faecimaris TaxID=686389 RepID=A0A521DEZ6_9RHOB|nr:hypothetical protein [Ruegeria faecimaris]SMO70259.1 hypothetical protein SAMN06265380_10622 [Ruegeria faecimaris]